MNTEKMEGVVRRLGELQERKSALVDKYEYDIRNSPLVIDESGQTQITDRTVIIALSTDQMRPDDTQAGGYSIIPLDRNSPLLFGYHDGKNTGTLIFFLKAVRKILKTTPKDEPLTIITRNHTTANYLKGDNNINDSNPVFPYLIGCIDDIEDLFDQRTAPVFGYWMEPENNVDWMKDFSELARKVASEARKLRLITDDDRQMDAAHSLPSVAPPQPPPRLQPAQQPMPPASPPTSPQHPQPGPLPVVDEIVPVLQKLANTRHERIEFLKNSGNDMGVIGNRHINLNNENLPPQERDHIAFISMSVDVRRADGNQAGGYGIVWIDNNTTNQFGYYDNPYPGTVLFLIMAVRDALAQCPKNEPLMIATTNHAIVNFINEKKPLRKNEHMDFCLEEIEHMIENRTAPTSSFLTGQYNQQTWVRDFYDMSRQVASEARKLGLAREFRPLPKDITELVPAPLLKAQSSHQQKQTKQKPAQSQKTQKAQNYSAENIDGTLRDLKARRIELLNTTGKTLRIGNKKIKFDGGSGHRNQPPKMVFIAMSTDIPRQDNGHQAGGYSAIWLNKKNENQFGNYDNPNGGTLIFLLKAVQEALATCPPNEHLIIASTNKAVDNFIKNVHNKPSQPMNGISVCLAEIEEQLRNRKAPTESVLLEKEHLQIPWIKSFYDLARKVASEARKLWFTYSDEEKAALASRIAKDTSSASHSQQQEHRPHHPVPMQPRAVPSSPMNRPDELPHGHTNLSNQSDQRPLGGMHPSRAAALGLIDTPSLPSSSSSVVHSYGHIGMQADRDQGNLAPTSLQFQELKIQPSVVVPSVSITQSDLVAPIPALPPPPQAMSHQTFQPRIPDNLQRQQLQGPVTVPPLSQNINQEDSKKRQLEDDLQNVKRQKLGENDKEKNEEESLNETSGWSNPVSKWVNKMFGR